jgi:hypothetical protein
MVQASSIDLSLVSAVLPVRRTRLDIRNKVTRMHPSKEHLYRQDSKDARDRISRLGIVELVAEKTKILLQPCPRQSNAVSA